MNIIRAINEALILESMDNLSTDVTERSTNPLTAEVVIKLIEELLKTRNDLSYIVGYDEDESNVIYIYPNGDKIVVNLLTEKIYIDGLSNDDITKVDLSVYTSNDESYGELNKSTSDVTVDDIDNFISDVVNKVNKLD